MIATKFSVYSDGSSCGNQQGPCGWGWVVLMNEQVLCAGSGGLPFGTNGLAELMGAREGLRALMMHPLFVEIQEAKKIYSIELVSDSQYVLGLANGNFAPNVHIELAKHVRQLCLSALVSTRWVRGHSGDTYNTICDKLAKHGKSSFQPERVDKAEKKRRRRKSKRPDPDGWNVD